MKELKRKTYLTIFSMLSLILIAVLIFVNIQNYKKEKDDVYRSLDIVDNRMGFRNDQPGFKPDVKPNEKPGNESNEIPGFPEPVPENLPGDFKNLENMIIMDHELYTAKIENGNITTIISHGNSTEGFDAQGIAEKILSENTSDKRFVGNLYFENYSYRFKNNDSIVIMNNEDISFNLKELLVKSLCLLIVFEIVIIFISKLLTSWITRPALDAFQKQKEFIADASHELKTPLAVIMASADAMTADDFDQNLDNIRYESDRMSRLIGGLLNPSRLENGMDKSDYKEENLSLILEKTCLSYEGVAFEMGVSINTDIDEGLSFKCNKDEIEQMSSTILDNAVLHSYKDTAVKVVARRKGKNGIIINIINKGDSIPEEDRERIFERFYRGDKARSREDNRYGLGLAIARKIARNHGGDITASSSGGETTFRISLK